MTAGPCEESAVAGRHRHLRGAFTFRDPGGVRGDRGRLVTDGRAYRADALHRLEAEDVRLLETLSIERFFDLRSEAELAKDGIGAFEAANGRHCHVPLVSVSLSPFDPSINWREMNLLDRYLEMLKDGGAAIRTVLDGFLEVDRGAVVFHCSGGKDRTGVVAAVLLRTLGVSDEDIVEDYASSEGYLRSIILRYRAELEAIGLDRDAVEYLTSSKPERMRRMLSELDRVWGSTEGYLDTIGFGADRRQRLRSRLLLAPSS